MDYDDLQIFPWEPFLPGSTRIVDKIGIHEPLKLELEGRKEEVEEIRAKTHVLIFDEIITGLRVPKNCVSSWWNIQPDLICLGKGLANGMPLSVVAGREEVMNCDDYFISSTFSGEAVSLAACKATLEELNTRNPEELVFHGQKFCDQFNEITKSIGARIDGYGSRGQTNFYEHDSTMLLFQELLKAGIFMGRAFFYNWAHLESNLDHYVLNVVSDCVNRIKSGAVELQGKRPQPTFGRNS